ncbi:hypothetical protein [Carboxylicivirga sp. N1Y90]|uniref:hypothetical protein n=1 Tax=Carboxylicivirga fragile TaxID=3417571 RepID=UPI003D33D562|nr:hypothetical protein [Marinilabiliaceae bacterium N1Y90]
MKKYPLLKLGLLSLILVGAINTSGQTKKEIQFSLDTLQKSHLLLQNDFESLQENWRQYEAFLEHLKAKTLDKKHINETLENTQNLFDEAWDKQVSHLKTLEDSTTFLLDSLNRLYETHMDMIERDNTFLRLLRGKLSEASFPSTQEELLGMWNLFLKPIQLSGDAFGSGLISHNPFTVADSIQQHNVYKIEFLEDELANIYFRGGKQQKCFYEVNDFDTGKPYTIECTKQDEFQLTLHISPMPHGLEVSYEIPVNTDQVLYFNGVMKP